MHLNRKIMEKDRSYWGDLSRHTYKKVAKNR